MTIEQTRAIIEPYVASHDPQYLAADAVFTDLSSGQTHEGREAIAGMLHYVYHVAFDAHAQQVSVTIGEGQATLEALFIGRHIGEFAGIPATGREVSVPLSVSYDVAPDGIKRARVYMLGSVMMEQLGGVEQAG